MTSFRDLAFDIAEINNMMEFSQDQHESLLSNVCMYPIKDLNETTAQHRDQCPNFNTTIQKIKIKANQHPDMDYSK